MSDEQQKEKSDLNREPESTQAELFTVEKEVFQTPIPLPWLPTDGRDELNLAEFPLAALSNRIAPGQKTLVFKDAVWDGQARQRVERQLTVMAADKYGLPNPLDDEIILALIQLSKRQGFTSKTVLFSRYEIIQILGWEDESWNYHRILQGLERWTSVTLKYENAWWDPAAKAWIDETFHIIERLTEVKDEQGKQRAAFVWSDVIFQNFQSGNLKNLDLDLYRRLNSATAKRLYRLLDKRFYRHRKAEFDLIDLAFHKLGVSQNYLIGNIKQRLQPAIEELEAVGFLLPASKETRYKKHGVGKWNIIFERAEDTKAKPGEKSLTPPEQPLSEVETLLVELGVSANAARRLVTTQPEGYLREKIDVVHFLKARKDSSIKNVAGYLVKSIEEQYALPEGYKTPEQRSVEQNLKEQQTLKTRELKQARTDQERLKHDAEAQASREREQKVAAYLDSLTPTARKKIAADSIAREMEAGRGFLLNHPGRLGKAARKGVLEDYVLNLIQPPSISGKDSA